MDQGIRDEMLYGESEEKEYYKPKDDRLFGSCVLQIWFENHAEYLKWKKYNGGDARWDFMVQYPAMMRREYKFHTTADLDQMTYKIVQLLQMGFKVRAVNWQLEEYKSQLKQPL